MSKEKSGGNGQVRNETILHMLRMRRSMKITELQEVLGVSDMTVRRCLNEMAAEGLLKRVHGGATIIDPWELERGFHSRVAENLETKIRLAEKVTLFVRDGGSIYLDGGTTCYEIAKRLTEKGKKCTVITDSIAIMKELFEKPHIEALLLGGHLSHDGNTMDGPMATDAARKISVDLCVFSCDTFDTAQIMNQSLAGTQTKRVMMERSQLCMCVTASNKFGKTRCFQFCEWGEVDLFVTDSGLPKDVATEIEAHGVEVHIAEDS